MGTICLAEKHFNTAESHKDTFPETTADFHNHYRM